ncbi:MAG: S-layer homology domain-containing protein [Tumebacillaceae bacterium]
MNKRFLSVLTCLMLLIGLFVPLSASAAAEDKATVKVRVVGLPDGKSIEAYVQVGAESFTNTSGDALKMDKPTALGALIAALKSTGTAPEIKTVSFGSYVTKIAGLSEKQLNANTGWSFWVNNQAPQVGADQAEIQTGDEIVWGYSDWSQTLYPKVELSTLHPELGKDFTVQVTADKTTFDKDFNATTTTVAVDGAVLYDANGVKLAETNQDGVATVNAATTGLISFYVDKTDAATGVPLLVRTGLYDVLTEVDHETYNDLNPFKWSKKPVEILAARGIVVGDGQGSFEPGRAVTRAELAKMVALTDDNLQLGGYARFSDLNGHPFQRYIETAVAKGYMVGDAEGTFRSNDLVTREELAVVLVRLAHAQPSESVVLPYTDAKQGGKHALPFVKTALDKGIMSGYADGTFRFHAAATRAEVATALVNVLWKDLL